MLRWALVFALCAAAAVQAWAQGSPAATGRTASPAAAAPVGEQLGWASLSAEQRRVLAPLKDEWAYLDTNRRSKWLGVVARYPQLTREQQERLQQRMAEWAAKSPQERAKARLGFQQSRQVPGDERQARWQAYSALSPEERAMFQNPQGLPAGDSPAMRPLGLVPMPLDAAQPKARQVGSAKPPQADPQPASATVMKPGPGATTVPMNRPIKPPAHQAPGEPRIAARPNQVDHQTLLPRKGPQAASAAAAAPAAAASRASTP